jgi:hypothetical protein
MDAGAAGSIIGGVDIGGGLGGMGGFGISFMALSSDSDLSAYSTSARGLQ